jgi:Ribosomal RNA adenine dimethylase
MEDNELKNKMIEWNKSYLEAIIDELHPSEEVLQVGFGLSHAASRIQTYHPKKHVIIENDPLLAKEAKNWASNQENISVIEGSWQNVLPTLGAFDSILFNDYPLSSDVEMTKRLSPEDAAATSIKAKELLNMLEKQLSQIEVQYSDEEMEAFYQKIGQFHPKEMPKLFQTLKDKKCISEQQYQNAVKKYNIGANLAKNASPEQQIDPMLAFLEECLKNHMRKGSRFSSFLSDTTSKYEDSQFFDRMITNPNLDYHEKLVSIQVPNYKFNEALVMVLEKFA